MANWTTKWPSPPSETKEEQDIIEECKKRFNACQNWEAEARVRFDFDYKFANGDDHNKYQWDDDILKNRELLERPCLTINKTQQHNLMVINDAKQNKPGIRIRPVSDDATFDAAQIYQELVYHTEYISNAENIYDYATVFQVEAGIGYWRVVTDWISPKSFDQEIYIKKVKDPRSVYLDMDINEQDGSDARFGIIFEDMPKDLFQDQNPKFAEVGNATLGGGTNNDSWITKDHIRVAEYYRKTENRDKLVTFTDPSTGDQILDHLSNLEENEKLIYNELKKNKEAQKQWLFRERDILTEDIDYFKIAGNRIIKREKWLGKYIPIVRLVGTETVIDGILDRKGHTRALINAQQIYNYSTSANVEYGALQTKSPWVAPTKAIEGYEEYYKTANKTNHSYMPYNHMDDEGNPIPPPTRPAAPQASPAYVQQMQIAQNEMMMASGQYQAQFGENENAKSGIAINARQRQGDRATYHFLDNQAMAIRFTGRILIDLYTKIYDTKRIKQILARDGTKKQIIVDPQHPVASEQLENLNRDKERSQQIEQIILNPTIGLYDVQSDTGPSFATRRTEAFNALTQIAAQNPKFMDVGGDLYFKAADFPDADILAERWRRIIPPNITGDTPDPQTEQLMHQASDKIEQLTAMLAQKTKELADKDKALDIQAMKVELDIEKAKAELARLNYEAETKRVTALGNSGPGISVEQIQPVLKQLLSGMVANGELVMNAPGPHEGGTVPTIPSEPSNLNGGAPNPNPAVPGGQEEEPPIEGAEKAPDGLWYVKNPDGSFSRVDEE